MSLLSKFSQVKIDPSKSLLQPSDLEFCQNTEADFKAAFSFYETKIEFYKINQPDLQGNHFLHFQEMLDDVETSIANCSLSFVKKIIRHFVETYKITLEEQEIIEKIFVGQDFDRDGKFRNRYRDHSEVTEDKIEDNIKKYNISLESILEQITDKLGGMTLTEKAETELREKFYKSFCQRYHKDKLELTKNRITFDNTYLSFDYWQGIKFEWKSQEKLLILCMALSFYETGMVDEVLPEYNTLLKNDRVSEEVMFSEWKIGTEKVSGIRFYKNRKMVIKFVSDEVASDFYVNMCKSGK